MNSTTIQTIVESQVIVEFGTTLILIRTKSSAT
jgi:hypothetical protein